VIAPAEPLQHLRILVVEDDPDVRRVVCNLLEHRGAHVVACACAEDALSVAATGVFDVVLSDVMMEGMGGRGLFDWLETRRPDLSARFVFMTAEPHAVRELAMRAKRPLLEKPFSTRSLFEACREAAGA